MILRMNAKYLSCKYFCLFLLLLFFSVSLSARDAGINNKRFYHIDSKDGLSSGQVSSILKTSDGYYWLGSFEGLNKYNGYDVKVYKSEEGNAESLSHNYVRDMLEDEKGNLWIATDKGLSKFNRNSGQFQRFLSSGAKNSLSHDRVRALTVSDGYLWVGTSNGLDKLNLISGEINNEISGKVIRDIVDDGQHLWVASDRDLLYFNKNTSEIRSHGVPNLKTKIKKIAKYQNNIWLATSDGLISFNLHTGKYDLNNHQLFGKRVHAMVVDESGTLWLGTANSGLFSYSIKTRSLIKVKTDAIDDFRLQSNSILTLMLDGEKLWVGTAAGVSYVSLGARAKFFRASGNEILDNTVWEVMKDTAGGVWVGTDQGVSYITEKGTEYFDIGNTGRILEAGSSILAVGWKGLFKYNRKRKVFESYLNKVSELTNHNNHTVFDILELDENQFLLATQNGCIYWDMVTNESHLLEFSDGNVPEYANVILHLYKYKDMVLLSTRVGLYTLKSNSKGIERYLDTVERTPLDDAKVTHVTSDQNEYLWVSTTKGLFKLKDHKIVKHYRRDDGLSKGYPHTAVVANGVLWVAANNGMHAFKIEHDQFEKIHLNDKQFDIEFNSGVVYQGRDELFFGSVEGVLYFDPTEYVESVLAPRTTITAFHLFNRPIQAGSTWLPQAIEFTKQLVFPHHQNMLTFEFSSLNIDQPDHVYAYQLQGLSDQNDWIVTDAKNRRATFTPGPGEYTFRVKSGWDKGNWSHEITEIQVTILPPWWQTNWAYATYIGIFLISLFSFICYRTAASDEKAEKLEVLVNERTDQLESSNEKLQQSNRQLLESNRKIEVLLERKNLLFANTSHELRTPLTLILGPVNKLLQTCVASEKSNLLLIERNAKRLAHMVDQLLALARTSSVSQDEFILTEFSDILSMVIHSLHSLLEERSIKISYDIKEGVFVDALPDTLEIIALNILSNAIKYTEPGGKVEVSLAKKDNKAIFRVKDTGIGIAEAEQTKIFEQFTRLDEAREQNIPGSGIGLALVKELVNLHHGNIELISEVNSGSEFVITLPLSENEVDIVNVDDRDSGESENSTLNIESYISVDGMRDQGKAESSFESHDTINHGASSPRKPNILIIDDTPDMLNYLQQLTMPEYNCMPVNNGADALKYAEEFSPDLVLCDVMMPGMDGFEVLESLRNNIQTSHIPVILLTAKGDKLSRLKGYQSQVDDYIAKPFDADELLARISNLIKSRAQLRQYFSEVVERGDPLSDYNGDKLLPKDKKFIGKIQSLMEENYHNHDYSVLEMMKEMHMSDRSLQNKLKAITGFTPLAYLIEYRLQKACEYLKDTDLSIQIIAEKVGFQQGSNLSRAFKRRLGKTPREYRG